MPSFSKIFFLSFFLFQFLFFISLKAQVNLVPNPSFESYTTCPNSSSQIEYAFPWFNPTLHSPDYFNSCSSSPTYSVNNNFFGDQIARTGGGYAGIGIACYNGTREYLEIKLSDSLLPSKNYYVEFYVSLSDSSNYATDDLGIYFSKNKIVASTIDSLPYSPQIKNASGNLLSNKVTWTKIQGIFSSPNYEKYIVIGNFNGHKGTDSVFVGNGGNPSSPNYSGAYYYIDDIAVIDAASIGIVEIPNQDIDFLIFNNTGIIDIYYPFEYTYELFSVDGKRMETSDLILKQKKTIFTEDLPSSIYILSVKSKYKTKTIKIIK